MSIDEALAAYRQNGSERNRDALATAISDRLLVAIRHGGVPLREVPDVAQDTVMAVLDALVAGKSKQSTTAFTWRAGVNAARDWYRRERVRGRDVTERADVSDLEQTMVLRDPRENDSAKDAKEKLACVGEAWDRLRPADREVLLKHIVEGVSIDELARRELAANPVSKSGEARTFKQARDAMDQKIHRARERLKRKIAGDADEGTS